MGMFDYIHYQGQEYQTKDTPCQMLDKYKIDYNQDSGHLFLWHEDYDSEWVEEEGPFGGHLRQFNERWVCCHDFDGLIRFYRAALENKHESWKKDAWIEYKALFMNGQLLKIERIERVDE
jgi:hypothetical protein